MEYPILPLSFYQRAPVTRIAKELLGKVVRTELEGKICRGIIVETEAYDGLNDKACHAHMNRRTKRTEIMYHAGGVAYVYLCYGIHSLFNIVTNQKDRADAVLIRALEPLEGIAYMRERRGIHKTKLLTSGPGKLTKAFGISQQMNKISLIESHLRIEDHGIIVKEDNIISSERIGIDYAGEDAKLPWRYYLKGNEFVSKK